MNPRTPHVLMDGPDIVCTHCAQRHTLIAVATPIKVFAAKGRAFMLLHRDCKPPTAPQIHLDTPPRPE